MTENWFHLMRYSLSKIHSIFRRVKNWMCPVKIGTSLVKHLQSLNQIWSLCMAKVNFKKEKVPLKKIWIFAENVLTFLNFSSSLTV